MTSMGEGDPVGLPAQPDDARRIVVTADDGRRVVLRTDDSVHSVTSAQTGLSEEQRARTRRYLISMAIRTACVVLVLVIDHPIRWLFAVGAIFLPYVAVVLANAGQRRIGSTITQVDRKAITGVPVQGRGPEH